MTHTFTRAFRSAAASLWLIMLVALAIRLGYMWQFEHLHPRQGISVIPFLFESGNIAHSLATGHGFSSPFRVDTGPTAWMTPLFPLLLAGIIRLFGAYTFHAWAATVLLNITCCTIACIPIYFTGRLIDGIRLAAGAAWLWAIFPNAILLPVESMWDASVSALLAATILWATLALAESQRLRDWCAYGLLWGIALMFNATLAALFPFLAGWLVYRARQEWRRSVRNAAAAVAIIILCCVPWTVRNYRVFHQFVPLRSVRACNSGSATTIRRSTFSAATCTRSITPLNATNILRWAKSLTCGRKNSKPSPTSFRNRPAKLASSPIARFPSGRAALRIRCRIFWVRPGCDSAQSWRSILSQHSALCAELSFFSASADHARFRSQRFRWYIPGPTISRWHCRAIACLLIRSSYCFWRSPSSAWHKSLRAPNHRLRKQRRRLQLGISARKRVPRHDGRLRPEHLNSYALRLAARDRGTAPTQPGDK